MKNIILVDIDGTIADCSHRLHYIQQEPKDWKAFHGAVSGDAPIQTAIDAVKMLRHPYEVWFVSGRCESSIDDTIKWLGKHFGNWDALIIRPEGDHTDDNVLKIRWLNDGTIPKERVAFALEDRDRVVKAYRAAGITCWQVAEGSY